jgi:DNA-binding IclR family transcriptional regulator
MYKIGMLVQMIEDAGPEGLTLAQLGARTQLPAAELDRALKVCVSRGYVRREGDRYKAKG